MHVCNQHVDTRQPDVLHTVQEKLTQTKLEKTTLKNSENPNVKTGKFMNKITKTPGN